MAKMEQGQGDVPLVPFQEALVADEIHAKKWAGVELHIYPSSWEPGPQRKPVVQAFGRKPLVMHS